MSLALLERAADALDDLRNDVVFVGGATFVLWITDPGAPTPRPTIWPTGVVFDPGYGFFHARCPAAAEMVP